MVNSRDKGYRFELRVLKKLQKLGFVVARQGRSRFPDIFAISRNLTFFGECKNREYIPKNPMKLLENTEYSGAMSIVGQTGKPFFLIYNKEHKIRLVAIGGLGVIEATELERQLNAKYPFMGRGVSTNTSGSG